MKIDILHAHRPLAFKGPIDHLNQFFSLDTLFQASQILLDDLMLDWQFARDEQLVRGVFLQQGQLVKTELEWPLTGSNECLTNPLSHCTCQTDTQLPACRHLAALAIETKVKLERLPIPVKSVEAEFEPERYLSNWLQAQNYDPFPSMARHRVVYILQWENQQLSVKAYKAYLTQQNQYQKKADLLWGQFDKSKLPKFISLTDQQVLQQLAQTVAEQKLPSTEAVELTFEFPQHLMLLQQLLMTRRCFWGNCYRAALTWQRRDNTNSTEAVELNAYLGWNKSKGYLFAINPTANLSSVADDQSLKELAGLVEKSSTQHLAGNGPAEMFVPCLTIVSEQLYLKWHNNALTEQQVFDIDLAKVTFEYHSQSFQLQQLLDIDLPTLQPTTFTQIITRLSQIDGIPGLASHFERPLIENFDLTDRYLNGNLSHWLVIFQGLHQVGWRIRFATQFRLNQIKVDDWYSQVSLPNSADNKNSNSNKVANQWFDLEVGVKFSGRSVNLLPYLVELLQHQSDPFNGLNEDLVFTLTDGNRIQISAQRVKNILENLVELSEKNPISKQQKLRMPISQFTRLLSLEKQLGQPTDWQNSQWLKGKAERLSARDELFSVNIPENIHATLRHYQTQGVAWLQFLRQENLAGILADDMGLGKSIQTLVHLQIEKNNGRLTSPSIIVAPTSMLGNWQAESQKFTPELKIMQWSGSQRFAKQTSLPEYDVIVTSYGILARDQSIFEQLNICFLILDEAQIIKNSRSQIAKTAFALSAQHRLCLTGTPLENHLGELWSLFNFLMPGFLGSEATFRRLFRIPIEKENNPVRQRELAQRIQLFMLRRVKDKVAADLPKKTIINEMIELTDQQFDLYEAVRLSTLEEVQTIMHSPGTRKNKLLIGNALLKLRQICCHPSLVKEFEKKLVLEHSAKLSWLATLLPEMLENNRRVLIFSSFTRALALIADLLESLSIDFHLLTGKTRNRTDLVKSFQEGNVPVFLISLKAGGAGLNLTQADTVIHFDPWWNPAAENQASDRAHRIGQDKPVFVYKLISKGTVEEKIFIMQQKKHNLANNVYQQNELAFNNASINWEELFSSLSE